MGELGVVIRESEDDADPEDEPLVLLDEAYVVEFDGGQTDVGVQEMEVADALPN